MQAGKYVTPDVTRALVVVISNASELQGYTVRALYRVFQAWDGQVLLLILSTVLFPKLCGCSPIEVPIICKELALIYGSLGMTVFVSKVFAKFAEQPIIAHV